MTYKLAFQNRHNYLYAKVSGENSIENVKRYLEEVLQKCKDTGCSLLLIEDQLDGPRLNTMNMFEIASEGSIQYRGHFKAIAYVDTNAEGELMQFAETVAVNRGTPVKFFQSEGEAEKWLIEKG